MRRFSPFACILIMLSSLTVDCPAEVLNLLSETSDGRSGVPSEEPLSTTPVTIRGNHALSGVASWYEMGNGRRTANGEIYDATGAWSCGWTAAHKTLPFNTIVRVRHLKTGSTVVVRINDRGPFVRGRIIDLSSKAARKVGLNLAAVKLDVLRIGNGATCHPPRYGVAAAKAVVKSWDGLMNRYNQTTAPSTPPSAPPSTEHLFALTRSLDALAAAPATASRDQITHAQRSITALGLNPGPVDGRWGPKTLRGVEAVRIQLAQRYLQALGFDPGPADGVVGSRTRTALQACRDRGFANVDTGSITPATVEALRQACSTTSAD